MIKYGIKLVIIFQSKFSLLGRGQGKANITLVPQDNFGWEYQLDLFQLWFMKKWQEWFINHYRHVYW